MANMLYRMAAAGSLGCLLTGTSLPATAEWMLKSDESTFHYVTSKAGAISEVNSFSELRGGISDDGQATLLVNLASVDTMIDIRNERVRDIVFQVEKFPSAVVTLDVNLLSLADMQAGDSMAFDANADVAINGGVVGLQARLRVTALADGGIAVENTRPLIINASSFGYAEGVEQLREIAGLPGINPNVVVDFSLVYASY